MVFHSILVGEHPHHNPAARPHSPLQRNMQEVLSRNSRHPRRLVQRTTPANISRVSLMRRPLRWWAACSAPPPRNHLRATGRFRCLLLRMTHRNNHPPNGRLPAALSTIRRVSVLRVSVPDLCGTIPARRSSRTTSNARQRPFLVFARIIPVCRSDDGWKGVRGWPHVPTAR